MLLKSCEISGKNGLSANILSKFWLQNYILIKYMIELQKKILYKITFINLI